MCDVNAEAKVYIRQDDGTLKPIGLDESLGVRLGQYVLLRRLGLTLKEIRYISETPLLGAGG
jgi:hypothetical protein